MKVSSISFVPYVRFHTLDSVLFQADKHPDITATVSPEGILLETDNADGTEGLVVPWHDIRQIKTFSPKPAVTPAPSESPVAAPSPAGAQTNAKPANKSGKS